MDGGVISFFVQFLEDIQVFLRDKVTCKTNVSSTRMRFCWRVFAYRLHWHEQKRSVFDFLRLRRLQWCERDPFSNVCVYDETVSVLDRVKVDDSRMRIDLNAPI